MYCNLIYLVDRRRTIFVQHGHQSGDGNKIMGGLCALPSLHKAQKVYGHRDVIIWTSILLRIALHCSFTTYLMNAPAEALIIFNSYLLNFS